MTTRTKFVIGGIGLLALLSTTILAVGPRGQRGVLVRLEEISHRDLVSTVTASGYVQPKRKVDISADISGRVTNLYVLEGQWVDLGDILLRIDPTSFEANVQRATAGVAQARAQAAQTRANLLRAESEADRAEYLAPQNLIAGVELELARTQLMVSQAQWEASEHAVAQAEAGLAEAREQLRKTTIVAPMSGRVTRLNIQQGETAVVGTMNNAGSLLLTIADLAEMETRVRVGETDVTAVQNGDSARIRIDAYPEQVFSGTVTRIANSAVNAPSTRSQASTANQAAQAIDFEVIVALDDPPVDLRPDLTATAEIITATRKRATAVPIIAVTVRDQDGRKFRADAAEPDPADVLPEVEGVFLFEAGVARWRPVRVGIVGDWYFEVLDGLQGGDVVISGPYAVVRDLEAGSPVRLDTSSPVRPGPPR